MNCGRMNLRYSELFVEQAVIMLTRYSEREEQVGGTWYINVGV